MTDVIIFAGTTEGRMLGEKLSESGINVLLCVATEYGAELINSKAHLEVVSARLDIDQMRELFLEKKSVPVVDATHPYAEIVTKNIKAALLENQEYIRLLRTAWEDNKTEHVEVSSIAEAVQYLNTNSKKALLTVGSKELAEFTKVQDFKSRLFARVLPMPEVVKSCTELGFQGRQLICMQGPFSHDFNVSLIEMLAVDALVTKDSGRTGGFYEKVSAAQQTGIQLIVVGRPQKEEGYSYNQVLEMLLKRYEKSEKQQEYPRFPIFISLKNKKVLVVGGGKIAQRRIKTLLEFGANVTLVSKDATPELEKLAEQGSIEFINREYRVSDLQSAELVIAATDKREVNAGIGMDAEKHGIYASVADKKEESSFYFPGIVLKRNLVAGVVSVDGDHKGLKQSLKDLREYWGDTDEDSKGR